MSRTPVQVTFEVDNRTLRAVRTVMMQAVAGAGLAPVPTGLHPGAASVAREALRALALGKIRGAEAMGIYLDPERAAHYAQLAARSIASVDALLPLPEVLA